MKYLVTGANGFLGSYLVKKLSANGHHVNAFVRDPMTAQHIRGNGITLFKGNILEPDTLQAACDEVEGVFHLAALTKVWAKDPKAYFDINVVGTMNVLEACIKANVRRVVVTSTAGVFGAKKNGSIDEKTARDMDYFNAYESSKALCESKIKDYVIDGLDVIIVSPTRIYGPFLNKIPHSVNLLIYKFVNENWRFIPGNGLKIANYVYIEDVVNGHILAMETGKKGQTYILGGTNHDYLEFFNTLKSCTGLHRNMYKIPQFILYMYAFLQLLKAQCGGEPDITPKWMAKTQYDWKVNPAKAVNDLGLKITPLQLGLQSTIEWMQKHYSPA